MIKRHHREQKSGMEHGGGTGIDRNARVLPSVLQRGSIMEKSWFMSKEGGCQAEQGMKVWADNDKCSPRSHPGSPPSATLLRGQGWNSSAPILCLYSVSLFQSPSFCSSSWTLSPSSSLPIICSHRVTWRPVELLLEVMEARQSPLSRGWAIRLCQTLSARSSKTRERRGQQGGKQQIYLMANDWFDAWILKSCLLGVHHCGFW